MSPQDDPNPEHPADRLRDDWRRGEKAAHAGDAPADADADRQRQDAALGSNDRLRDEAPDDAETRRRADELEREIKRSRRPENS